MQPYQMGDIRWRFTMNIVGIEIPQQAHSIDMLILRPKVEKV